MAFTRGTRASRAFVELIYVMTFGGRTFHGPVDGTEAEFEDVVPLKA